MVPERDGAFIVLVFRHVALDVAVIDPPDRGLKVFLAIGGTFQELAGETLGRAILAAEILLGIRYPRAVIDRVAQFLFGEHLSRDVYSLEPVKLVGVCASANVDHEFVIQNSVLPVVLKVVEGHALDGVIAPHVLAYGYGALLAVDYLKRSVAAVRPIHHVEGKTPPDGLDDGVAFLFAIDELALVWRADVEFSAIARHAALAVVAVALGEFPNRRLKKVDLRAGASGLRLRITSLSKSLRWVPSLFGR